MITGQSINPHRKVVMEKFLIAIGLVIGVHFLGKVW